jgi:hypothetical protein
MQADLRRRYGLRLTDNGTPAYCCSPGTGVIRLTGMGELNG